MLTKTYTDLEMTLTQIGLSNEPWMLGMHLSEIEEEARNMLDLLATVRRLGQQGDIEAGQETLAELTVVLGHLFHHAREALPILEKQLDLEELASIEELCPQSKL